MGNCTLPSLGTAGVGPRTIFATLAGVGRIVGIPIRSAGGRVATGAKVTGESVTTIILPVGDKVFVAVGDAVCVTVGAAVAPGTGGAVTTGIGGAVTGSVGPPGIGAGGGTGTVGVGIG